MHEIEVTGTFLGHWLPGALFLAWAFVWVVDDRRGGPRPEHAPLERSSTVSILKIVLPLVIVCFEIPNRGWVPSHALQGWHHIAMDSTFAATGVVDFLVRRGRLAWWGGHAAFAGAMANAAFLFVGHGHGGVPGVAHLLLAALFLLNAIVPLVELARPGLGLHRLRFAVLLALGGWFLTISWILFRSGWDMADPLRAGWTYLLFSLNGLTVAVAVTALLALTSRPSDRSPA